MTQDAKAVARKAAFAARKAAHGAGYDTAVTRALLREIGPVEGQVIAGYMPIRTEASPTSAMETLAATNRICVPVIKGKALPLTFREWHPGVAMVEGAFGAAIPAEGIG